jgi:hypothetical protein
MVNRPHPLFGFVVVAVALGVAVGVFADAHEPTWALRSEWVYRAELGAAMMMLLYLPVVALLLAWRGETFRRVQAPGGAGFETPAAELDSAAKKFAQYERQSEDRFRQLENALGKLKERIEELEA